MTIGRSRSLAARRSPHPHRDRGRRGLLREQGPFPQDNLCCLDASTEQPRRLLQISLARPRLRGQLVGELINLTG